MNDVLARIKRAVITQRLDFTDKARSEMRDDGITEVDACEALLNAVAIYKKLRSTSPLRKHDREYLYVIQSPNLHGMAIYTKGKWVKEPGEPERYLLISCKGSE